MGEGAHCIPMPHCIPMSPLIRRLCLQVYEGYRSVQFAVHRRIPVNHVLESDCDFSITSERLKRNFLTSKVPKLSRQD